MKNAIRMLLLTALALGAQAQTNSPFANLWRAVVTVLDENGRPLPGANVAASYYVQPPPGRPVAFEQIQGLTDTNGVFRASHSDTSVDVGFLATKAGYYKASLGHEFARFKEGDPRKWTPTITLILKRVGNPIPMYAKRILQGPPVDNTAVGYDLEAGDWVAPHGKGLSADIIFTRHVVRKARHDYDDVVEVTFSNAGDGIQPFTVPDDQKYSGLRSPHEAPLEGYQPRLVQETSEHPGQAPKFGYDATRNYFFRVRTLLDEKGNVKSALYGKIYGDFMQFSYYLNPMPNDRNVEFDPKQNLLKGLRGSQIVDAP